MRHEDLLRDYAAHRPALSEAALHVESELRALLESAGVAVHFVASRLKTDESLRRKLGRPEKTYRSIWDVTDLVGLRISTYFEDAILDVARIIEERFAVDYRHSTDKLRFKDHGRFGYRSMHYVCAFRDPPHADARFEIQIRTALQHAWAEVEHDLGYKAQDAVPEMIRRRFSRIASLLEIADQEFVSIRNDLRQYQAAAHDDVSSGGRGLPIDAVSLEAAARTPHVEELDQRLALLLDKPLIDTVFYPSYLARMAELAGLNSTEALRCAILEHGPEVARIAPLYFGVARSALLLEPTSFSTVERGYSLLFVAHCAILRGPELGLSKVARLTRMYAELDFSGDERKAQSVASALVEALTTAW